MLFYSSMIYMKLSRTLMYERQESLTFFIANFGNNTAKSSENSQKVDKFACLLFECFQTTFQSSESTVYTKHMENKIVTVLLRIFPSNLIGISQKQRGAGQITVVNQ